MPNLEGISQEVLSADVGNHEQLISKDENRGWGAMNEVLLSADILPVIVFHLREPLPENDEEEESNALIIPILRINRAFFDAGANILWEKIDGLDPLFKLLPWYETLSESDQVPDGTSETDWDRFNLYSPRVRELTLSCGGEELPPSWFRGLGDLSLPGMPVPMFPKLRRASISSIHLMSSKTLSLLISPTLEELLLDCDGLPQGYEPSGFSPHLAIQTTASTAQDLQTLHYTGPIVDPPFFSDLAKLTNLTSVTAYLSGSPDAWAFQCLRELPLLEHLSILLIGSVEAGSSREKSMKGLRMCPHTSLTTLQSLGVMFGQYQQCRVAKGLSPKNLRRLMLAFLVPTDLMPVHLAIGLYLQENRNLEDLEAKFVQSTPDLGIGPEVLPPESRIHWPSVHEATDLLSSTLQKSTNIRRIEILEIPFHLAISTSRVLCNALPCIGTSLVSLHVNVDLQVTDRSWGFSAGHGAFPGLSFLATTIWLQCPNLDSLALHFDTDLICHEDLKEPLSACEPYMAPWVPTHKVPGFAPKAGSRGHGLRILAISSGSPSHDTPPMVLPPERKNEIASFIHRLFPTLEAVTGSGVWASKTWEEVNVLVEVYRSIRAMVTKLEEQIVVVP